MSAGKQPHTRPTEAAPQSAPWRSFVALSLALVFEAATVLLVAWAVVFHRLALFGLVEMVVFVAFLALAYCYAWRLGAFDRT